MWKNEKESQGKPISGENVSNDFLEESQKKVCHTLMYFLLLRGYGDMRKLANCYMVQPMVHGGARERLAARPIAA